MDNETRKRRFPIVSVLIAVFALVLLSFCGGGIAYLDYYAGSTSSGFMKDAFSISVVDRGFRSQGTQLRFEDELTVATVAGLEFAITPTAISHENRKLVEFGDAVGTVEISSYRGRIQIMVDNVVAATLPE